MVFIEKTEAGYKATSQVVPGYTAEAETREEIELLMIEAIEARLDALEKMELAAEKARLDQFLAERKQKRGRGGSRHGR